MLSAARPISSLLSGVGLLLLGSGLYGTLLAVRGSIEGYSDRVLGVIMSAYFVGFLIGTYLAPALIRRVGHIRSFAICATVASCAAIGHAIWVHPLAWALLRMLIGTCLVTLYTAVESWLNAQAPPGRRGQVFALYMIVNLLALALGQYLILAAPASGFELFAFVSMLFSLALVPVSMTRLEQPQPVHAPKLGLKRLIDTAPVSIAGVLVSGLVMGAFWGMGPVFANRIGLDASGIAAFMSAAILGGAALQWPLGHYSDTHDRRRVLGLTCLAAAAVAVGGLLLSLWMPRALLPVMFAYGGLVFTLYPICMAHLVDRLTPDAVLEGSSGLLLIYGIGAAVGPALAGLAMDLAGSRSLLAYFAAFLLPMGLYALLAARELREEGLGGEFLPMVRTSPSAMELMPTGDPPQKPDAG